ncbi:hypothetical protein, partial [Sphingobacterium luzhongxinii]|uniref:hypothetical protein n=1 Tax=Sphingobacterium luzhongxinii TaxID=2654181 RepID=UPI001969AB44
LAFILSQDQTLHCKMKCKTKTIYENRIVFIIISDSRTKWLIFNFRRFSTLLVTLHDHFLKNFIASASRFCFISTPEGSTFLLFLLPFVSVGTAKVGIFFRVPK